jgi:hypothetical protein
LSKLHEGQFHDLEFESDNFRLIKQGQRREQRRNVFTIFVGKARDRLAGTIKMVML